MQAPYTATWRYQHRRSWHHSLCELMTLEKSSIGPRLEVATPLTRWKHAFSRTVMDGTSRVRAFTVRSEGNTAASIAGEQQRRKTDADRGPSRVRLEIGQGDSAGNTLRLAVQSRNMFPHSSRINSERNAEVGLATSPRRDRPRKWARPPDDPTTYGAPRRRATEPFVPIVAIYARCRESSASSFR